MSVTKAQLIGNVSAGASFAGIVTATSINAATATFTGNVSVGGTLTYEDVTNVDSVGLITARSGVQVTGGSISISSGGIVVSGVTTVSAGSTSAPSITPSGDENTGVFFPSADTVALSSGGTERIKVDSSGNIDIDSGGVYYDAANNRLAIGTTSPGAALDIVGGSAANLNAPAVFIENNKFLTWKNTTGTWAAGAVASTGNDFLLAAANNLTFGSGSSATERARIDSSGRLLVGTSTARSNFFALPGSLSGLLQIEGLSNASRVCSFVLNANDVSGPLLVLGKSRGTTAGSYTVVSSGDQIGGLSFQGSDGSNLVAGASISAEVDGTPGANDMPGRLVFSTTADGASSPTERMRITSAGTFVLSNGSFSSGSTWGFAVDTTGTSKILMRSGGSAVGVQLTNGATAWSSFTSESRLKNIIGDVDKNQAWELVRNVELKRYYYKSQEDQTGVPYMGPMADWLEQQDPELVIYNEPDEEGPVRTFNQAVLDTKALAALQLALERIEVLEQRLTDAGIA